MGGRAGGQAGRQAVLCLMLERLVDAEITAAMNATRTYVICLNTTNDDDDDYNADDNDNTDNHERAHL
eukprot:15488722-Heterocapsa_arctica.AAC.1